MDLNDESPESPIDSTAIQNGDKEESCVLIEENISIVDIADDTIQEELQLNDSSANNNETSEELIEESTDAIPSEYQVIDEVCGSQELVENGGVEDEINGVSLEF
jgi:hypothetical protein